MSSQLDAASTRDGVSQTQPTSFADSESLIIRGAISAKT
jgi:hypothetical protein